MEEKAIPITPEASPVEKKKPKRSAKPKRDQPEEVPESAIQTHPAPESATPVNGAAKPYDWDRTIDEDRQRAADDIIRKTPFPQPPAKTVSFSQFCDYWEALIQLPASRYARLYVRRWWPVCLPEETEDLRTGLVREGFPGEKSKDGKGTLTSEFGPLSEQRVLDEFGVGDYTIRLNDTRREFTQATVVHCEKFATKRDYSNHPPDFDLKRLDWDDPSNGPYIKWAQSRGILPMEREHEKEASDMAATNVAEAALNDARAERARTDQIQREAIARAELAAKEAKDALAREQAEKQASKPEAPKPELLSVVESVAALAKSLQPAKDDSLTKYLEVQAQREQTQRERDKEEREAAREAARVERERADKLQNDILNDLRTKAQASVAAAPTFKDSLKDIIEVQTALGQIKGTRSAPPEEKNTEADLDKWIGLATALGPIAQGFIQGVFRLGEYALQTWQTVSHNSALLKSGNTPADPAKPTEPKPMPPSMTPEQQAQQAHLVLMMTLLDKAAEDIGNVFGDGETGDMFAAMVIKVKKRPVYDKIRMLGQTGPNTFEVQHFVNVVRGLLVHPQRTPAVAKLAGEVMDKPTFGKFLEDFFNYDDIEAARVAAEEGQE